MIPEIDVWHAALRMTQCFRRDAADQAAACAEDLAASDAREASMWRRIAAATERLRAPGEAEAVH